MGFRFKKFLSICLSLGLLLSVESCIFAAAADNNTNGKKITEYSVGDILEFGWYPQSKVEDSDIIVELNSLAGDNSTWTSYGYYSGTGSSSDGQMTAGDWMRYTDVIYGSNKYRGVIFDSYRPYYTGDTSSTTGENEYGNSISEQKDNGYNVGTVYWFLYEPIKWRVLDPKTGMVMSETILDSQAYNNYIVGEYVDEYGGYYGEPYFGNADKTYYANNYAESSIRQWLNNDFYNTAFSSAQQDIIAYTTLDNSAYSEYHSKYDAEDTTDKIYLLSYSDMSNTSYGFDEALWSEDTARMAKGSDYAKSQGLYVYTYDEDSSYYGNSYWRLRSAGRYSIRTCEVYYDGYVGSYYPTDYPISGVRPALNFNLSSDIFQSEIIKTVSSEINIDEENSSLKFSDDKKNLYSAAGQTVEQIIAATGDVTEILKSDGTTAEKTDKIASGMKIVLKDKDGNVIDEKTIIVLGDVGGDGEIEADDARTALRASVGLDTLNEWQALAANVDGENEIEASDARLILRASVGLDTFSV